MILILFSLVDGPDRFNSLKTRIEGISQLMLTQDMERDGYVERTVYPQAPVKVEYELTDMGQGLAKAVWGLVSWADEHHETIRAARQTYDEENGY
ncbi:winged helix-turn-helix transcriptional regulator [Litoribrevibacter euphylliae]|uniref:Winged helix-turn-helix transcriptional regulator n=1 Tax=Litoribrevibacter euphylliae TaxID=1834034 RepID=A0ABV7HA70_9GAMM